MLVDRYRLVVQSLGDELAATTQVIQQIVALLVDRVETADRDVVCWLPTGPAEPFFDSALPSPLAPPDGLEGTGPPPKSRSRGTRASIDRGASHVTDRLLQRAANAVRHA